MFKTKLSPGKSETEPFQVMVSFRNDVQEPSADGISQVARPLKSAETVSVILPRRIVSVFVEGFVTVIVYWKLVPSPTAGLTLLDNWMPAGRAESLSIIVPVA
jgi:hypothetical protein